MSRHAIRVKKARIFAGAFVGCERDWLASSLDVSDGKETARRMSEQEPEIFGLFAEESHGWRNLAWFKAGGQV